MRNAAVVSFVALAMTCTGRAQTPYNAYQVTGGPYSTSLFRNAYTGGSSFRMLAADGAGNIYTNSAFAFFQVPQIILKITPDGAMSPLAGAGAARVVENERIPALLTSVVPTAMAADARGNLFLAENRILRVDPAGSIEVYSPLNVFYLAVDGAGNVYGSLQSSRVVRVAADRSFTIVAGNGTFASSGDGGPATSAAISVTGLAADTAGNLYIAEPARIRRVDTRGTIQTVAEVPARAMVADNAGGLYFLQEFRLRYLAPDGVITTLAGIPFPAPYRGDGGPATNAWLTDPSALAIDPAGNLYIADQERLRIIDRGGIIRTLAGCPCLGDREPATSVQVSSAYGIVRDAAGNTYFSDQRAHMVRRIAPDGTISTVAGNGESGFSGDDGPAREARLSWPAGLALDAAGNLYIADTQNDRIRRVTPSGVIQTVAGNGDAVSAGDGGPARAAGLSLPEGVVVDSSGNVYIAETAAHRIRKVTTDGIIRTIAGSEQWGTTGDGGPAIAAQMINPRMLALDRAGNLLFTDSAAHTVRRITPAGTIDRVAGTGDAGSTGDGGPALLARLELPWGIAVDDDGNILIGDRGVRVIDAGGTIRRVATVFPQLQGTPSTYGVATGTGGDIWMAAGSITVLSRGGPPFPLGPQVGGNGALFTVPPPPALVSPGEIVTISGARLGPSPAVSNTPSGGKFSTVLAGVKLMFEGIEAPLIAVESASVTAVVPYGVAAKSRVDITAEVNGLRSNSVTVAVLPADPHLFESSMRCLTDLGSALPAVNAIDERGRDVNLVRPLPGSIVSLYGTGTGVVDPPVPDGIVISGPQLPKPSLPVSVTTSGRPLEVTYAGSAPGLVAGTTQINLRVPTGLTPGTTFPGVPVHYFPIEARVGESKSATYCLPVQ